MKKIEQFTNCYSLSKTLQFKLLPIGKTQDNFDAKQLLLEDEQRAKTYPVVKGYMDRYHKAFIESVLSKLLLDGVREYSVLYYKADKTTSDCKSLEKLEESLRKQISKAFQDDVRYEKMLKKEMVTELLPNFLTDDEELSVVEQFNTFTTYFSGFYKNRENIYSKEAKSTAISYRCINDNLPKFLDNVKSFAKVKDVLSEQIEQLNSDFEKILSVKIEDAFNVDYFSFVLSQSGIKLYNEIIGGYTFSDGKKVQGLNEYINLYNQTADRSNHLPLMKHLFKQILSDAERLSFIPEKFESDGEVLSTIGEYYSTHKSVFDELGSLFGDLEQFDLNGIYLSSGEAINQISNTVFGNWSCISNGWKRAYGERTPLKDVKKAEKYYEARDKAYKAIKSFSVSQLQSYGTIEGNQNGDIAKYFSETVPELVGQIKSNYEAAQELLTSEHTCKIHLYKNEEAIELIKKLLDSIKALERCVKPLLGTGKEEYKDNTFYSRFLVSYESLSAIDRLYDKVRNYMTQKPYSKDKIKLNFGNPQFMGGWDRNKESDYSAVLLFKDQSYYIAVTDDDYRDYFKINIEPENEGDIVSKIVYKQISSAPKYFSSKQINPQNPPENISRYLDKGFDKKTISSEQLEELIRYVAEDFIPNYPMLRDENNNMYFNYKFRNYSDYASWNDFMNDIEPQSYSITYKNISFEYVMKGVDEGEMYLFRIYNKDFSEYSKGTPNLHTIYFKMLFDERNLENVVYKLNGSAEMFYRKASITEEEIIRHPAKVALDNKNPDNHMVICLLRHLFISVASVAVDNFIQ